MKSKFAAASAALVLGLSTMGISSAALADNAEQMMQQHGCFACHAVDHKVVGPAYDWVAYRYKGDKKAVKMLAEKIIKGGAGNWNKWTGGIPMSPNALTMAQAEAAAKWILALKPVKPPAP